MKIIELEEVDSTNEYLKRVKGKEDALVVAVRQTAGKGTKGRSFSSESGGLYISYMQCNLEIPASQSFKIMVNACVAVCRTLEAFGIAPTIRWANDVLVNGKKICGTLIENTFSGDKISRSIVGMGININNTLPKELKDIAVSMKDCLAHECDFKAVKNKLIENLGKSYTVEEYKEYIDWFGKRVTLKTNKEEIAVTAIDVSGDGRLIVDNNGKRQLISAGEVSLRI